MAELSHAGLTGMGISLVNYLDELPFFCDEVLPRLERMGLRETRRRARRCRRDGDVHMKEDDDDRPKKKITHEIGQDLYLLSVKELEERIALLTEEIERLKASIAEQAIVARRRGFVFQEVTHASRQRARRQSRTDMRVTDRCARTRHADRLATKLSIHLTRY